MYGNTIESITLATSQEPPKQPRHSRFSPSAGLSGSFTNEGSLDPEHRSADPGWEVSWPGSAFSRDFVKAQTTGLHYFA
jgi:hypothetical protein